MINIDKVLVFVGFLASFFAGFGFGYEVEDQCKDGEDDNEEEPDGTFYY